VIPSGEETKNFHHFEQLLDAILSLKPDRYTTLIALGGGVVGDITGFAASVVLRGIPFIQVPTTLLAMVDSSVGGKTGINTNFGKNMIGSFYQPLAVIADTTTLKTLPEREIQAGFAEIIKYGLIDDAAFFTQLEEEKISVTQAISASCLAKARIVAQDERESGKRALLNLGHTFGHALETEMGYDGTLLHGEAVAIGMTLAFEFSAEQAICSRADAARVKACIASYGLPTSPLDIASHWNVKALMRHMAADKKAKDDALTLILAKAIGQSFIAEKVDAAAIQAFWKKILKAA
jgi:3-dehydroquinate synthase